MQLSSSTNLRRGVGAVLFLTVGDDRFKNRPRPRPRARARKDCTRARGTNGTYATNGTNGSDT
jgi:hypothetical protein